LADDKTIAKAIAQRESIPPMAIVICLVLALGIAGFFFLERASKQPPPPPPPLTDGAQRASAVSAVQPDKPSARRMWPIAIAVLGGLAIAIGELVDDAIIDVENVMRRLRENSAKPDAEKQGPIEVIYRASIEIRSSVVFATIIVVMVFLPLFALTSVEGRLLRPLGFAYITSLLASLVVALTVTPVLCSYLLPRAKSILRGHEPRLARTLKAIYAPVLRASLRGPILVLATALALIVGAGYQLSTAGRAFLPDFNEGSLTVNAVTVPGTSLAQSDALGSALERILLSVPEVVSTARRTGRCGGRRSSRECPATRRA
jgi:Cu/Ag efflux pump CusA